MYRYRWHRAYKTGKIHQHMKRGLMHGCVPRADTLDGPFYLCEGGIPTGTA